MSQRRQLSSTATILEGEVSQKKFSQQNRNLSHISGVLNQGYNSNSQSNYDSKKPNTNRTECESKSDETKCNESGGVTNPSTGKRIQKCKWKYSRCFYNLDLEDVFEKKKEKVNTEIIEFVFNKTNLLKDLNTIVLKLNTSLQIPSEVSIIQPEEQPTILTNTIVDIFVLGFSNGTESSINNGKYYFENNEYKNYQELTSNMPSSKILAFVVNDNVKEEILSVIKGVDEAQLRNSLNKSNKIILFYNYLNQVTGFVLLPNLENIFDNNLLVYELVNISENTYRLNPNVMISNSVLSVYKKLVLQTNTSFQSFIQGTLNKQNFKNAGIDLNHIIIFEEVLKKIINSSNANNSFYLNFVLTNIENYKQELLNDPQLSILYTIKQEYCDKKETLTNAQSVLDTLICLSYFINENIKNLNSVENLKISTKDEDDLKQRMILLYDLVYNLISLREFVISNSQLIKMLILVPKPELEKEIEKLKTNETISEDKIEKENIIEDAKLIKEINKAKEFILTHEKTISDEKIFEAQVTEYEKQIKIQNPEKEQQLQREQELEDEKSKYEEKLEEAEIDPIHQEIEPTLQGYAKELNEILGKLDNLKPTLTVKYQDEYEDEYEDEDDAETKSGFLNKLYSKGTSIIISIINYLNEYFDSFQRLSGDVLSSTMETFDIKKLLDKFLTSSSGIKDKILYYINKFSEALGGAFSSISSFIFKTILPSTFSFLFDVLMFCFSPIKYLFTVIIPYLFSMINLDFPWRTVEYLFTSIICICKTIINNLLNLLYYIFISPVPKVLNMIMEYFFILYSKFSIFILSLGTMTQSKFLSLLPIFEYWGIQSNLIISSIGESIGNTIINSAKYGGNVSLAVIEYTSNADLSRTNYAAKAIGNSILSGSKKVSDVAIQSTIASLQFMAELIPTFSCILYNGLIYFVRGTSEIAIERGLYGCIIVKEMTGALALSAMSSSSLGSIEVYNFTTGTIVPLIRNTGVNAEIYLGHAAVSGSQVGNNALSGARALSKQIISGSKIGVLQTINLLSLGGEILSNASLTALDFGFTQAKLGKKTVKLTLVNMGSLGQIYVLPLAGEGFNMSVSGVKSILNFLTSQIYVLCINLLELVPTFYDITLQSGVICLKFSASMLGLFIKSMAKISSMIITSVTTRVKNKSNPKYAITEEESSIIKGADKLTKFLMESVSNVSQLKVTKKCPATRPYFCSAGTEFRSSPRGFLAPCVENKDECEMPWATVDLTRNHGTISSKCTVLGKGEKCDDIEEAAKKIACASNLNGNNVYCPKGKPFRVNPDGSYSRGNKNPCVKNSQQCNMPWESVNLSINSGVVSSRYGGKNKKTKNKNNKNKNKKNNKKKITKKNKKYKKTIKKRKLKKNVTRKNNKH